MKKILFALAAIMFVFAGSTVFSADNDRERGVISLNITESKETEPNIAKVSFAVETTAQSAQKASEENNSVANKVVNAIKAISTEKDNVKTTGFSVRPNYVYAKDSTRSIKNYTAYNSVTVETRDIEKVSKYIDVAIANGANRTDNLSYSFENPGAICSEMYPVLTKKLREQADSIAKSAGNVIDGIKYVNAGCNTSYNYRGRLVAAKAVMNDAAESNGGAFEATPAEAGKVKIQVSVSAEFYVKRAL